MFVNTRGREVHRVRAPERQRVGGDLHRAGPVTAVEHRAEVGLQVDRLGRGAGDRPLAPADHRLDGAQQAALLADRLQQRAHQVGAWWSCRSCPVTPTTRSSALGSP